MKTLLGVRNVAWLIEAGERAEVEAKDGVTWAQVFICDLNMDDLSIYEKSSFALMY